MSVTIITFCEIRPDTPLEMVKFNPKEICDKYKEAIKQRYLNYEWVKEEKIVIYHYEFIKSVYGDTGVQRYYENIAKSIMKRRSDQMEFGFRSGDYSDLTFERQRGTNCKIPIEEIEKYTEATIPFFANVLQAFDKVLTDKFHKGPISEPLTLEHIKNTIID